MVVGVKWFYDAKAKLKPFVKATVKYCSFVSQYGFFTLILQISFLEIQAEYPLNKGTIFSHFQSLKAMYISGMVSHWENVTISEDW